MKRPHIFRKDKDDEPEDHPERFRPRPPLRREEYVDADISEHFKHGMRDEDDD
jgi:hypothetical protein